MLKNNKKWISIIPISVILIAIGFYFHTVEDNTNGRSNICKIHSKVMKKALVTIFYGLPTSKWFEEAKIAIKSFPNAKDYISGGCVVKSKQWTWVYICSDCENARIEWLKKKQNN